MAFVAGGSDRPDDLRVPADDEVHLPQVRHVRQHREARRALHPAAQHRQRKDLHLHLVLAPHPGIPHFPHLGESQVSD